MYRLMIVEDEPPILDMLCSLVQGRYSDLEVVATAANGKAALRRLKELEDPPDILITDIEMPVMDGMELIRQVNERYPQTVCVILSGHDDFEYARTAVRLQVYDYLLKPITAGNLDELIQKLLAQLKQHTEQSDFQFIQSAIHAQQSSQRVPETFRTGRFYMILLIAGHLCNQYYDAFGNGQNYWNDAGLPALLGANLSTDDSYWLLDGKFPNEKIVVIKSRAQTFSVSEICRRLFERLRRPQTPVNLIYGPSADSLAGLPAARKELIRVLTHDLIYAQSNLYDTRERRTPSVIPTREFEKRVAVLAGQRDINQYQIALKAILEDLQKLNCTQMQLQTILQYYVLQLGTAKQPVMSAIDVGELLGESANYEILWENLCCSVRNYLGCEKSGKQPAAKDLVARMEAYLIENYNQTITSKDFFDLFGYNENYLTNVFRSVRGISPSKFITQLRIQKAQELLDRNPDMMVKVVAELVGYEDSLYFSRVFKNIVGCSPSEYKNLAEKNICE